MLSEFAPAKVNLFLHVTAKREDGYHLLDSLAVFPAVGDRLTLAPDDALSLSITGRFGAALTAEPDNLVLRAARRLASSAGRIAAGRLVLEKNLPVASGIGGGSADAAAALRLLAREWTSAAGLRHWNSAAGLRHRNSASSLPKIALSLGADVPVCLASRSVRMGGVGEILSPAPGLPVFGIVLVNPGIPVATADVFRARQPVFSAPADLPAAWPDAAAMAAGLAALGNDLEAPAIALAPGIAATLAALRALRGALLARMSGSGATCFAIFKTPAEAAAAAAALERPGWWCWGGGLYEPGLGNL
jgi:4-diphosphocytidyl-2-C-methyl-D-erythritol kinase